jgi:hypothetical protein
VKKQIPDPQVKDAADQFWTAADLLRAQPPGSGVLLPEIINFVLALELYLAVHERCGGDAEMHNKPINSDSKKRRSFVALFFAAGYVRR